MDDGGAAGLLDQLGLTGVTVIGNSIGGWIAAEIALLGSPRVSAVVLVDAAGLVLSDHPAPDFFSLTMDQVADSATTARTPFAWTWTICRTRRRR